MINDLKLTDFQSHELSTLEFSKQINIITGTSNSGKSSLVRAVNWIKNNRPLGNGFIKDDKDEASAVLGFSRRGKYFQIVRRKTRKSNGSYEISFLEDSGGKVEEFQAFGNSVPKEVGDILNFSDINLQQQLSPYFLVLDSPGQVALYIRKVAKLDEIDKVVSLLSGEVRDCLRRKSDLEEELLEIEKELEELSLVDLDRLEKVIGEVERIEEKEEELSHRGGEISVIVALVKQIDETMICLPDDIQERVEDTEVKLLHFSEFLVETNTLKEIVFQLRVAEEEEINLPKNIESKVSSVENLFAKYNNDVSSLVCLSEGLENLEAYKVQLVELGKEDKQLEENRKDILSRLKECPYCGQKLSDEAKIVFWSVLTEKRV